ncbi:hypothetical protein BBO99_00004521 [Phytophthora kernoviae]|uniref:Uncharacterized protein n=1 Tax=Phytophthora kernoviae TaxID=325452 RepID=A0A421GR19_9STRA|nr:hypothetical protein JM18_003838 [Phytophthora kernoviae]RLN15151.1 hypothetical protein BBI17_004713 [Phytophthora kernoviae]RLN80402.1 hypothetical protein BBO99_00004521 [Phytophthora kernoviae]
MQKTKLWSSRLAQNAAVLKAVEQYYAVFQQGLHNPEAGGDNVRKCFRMQLGFLAAFLDTNVQYGDSHGVKEVLEQSHRYTQFHSWIEVGFVSAEVFGPSDSPVVVAQGTLTALINCTTLEKIFPNCLNEPRLATSLVDRVVEYHTTTTFSFNERAQVERMDTDVDFLGGLSRLLGNTIDASRLLQGAHITEGSKMANSVEESETGGQRWGMVERELQLASQDREYNMA